MIEKYIKILIIEDDHNMAKSISRMLFKEKKCHFDITHADCLKDGLVCLSEKSFDVILLDLTLPDSKRLSTLQVVNKKYSDTPIIVLTGINDEKIDIEALKTGAQDFIYKPDLGKDHLISSIFYAIERKNIEKSIINRELSCRHLAETAKEMIFTCDIDGIINYVNRSALVKTGYSTDEIIGLEIARIVPEDQVEKLIGLFEKRAVTEDSGVLWQGDLVTKDGNLILSEVSITPFKVTNTNTGFLIVARDISNREKVFKAVKNNEIKLYDVIEKNAEGIAIIDPNGVILYTNPAYRELFGNDTGDYVGENIEFDIEPDKKSEIEIGQENGHTLVVEVQTVKTEWEGLDISLCTFHDVTLRKKFETELKRTTEDLRKNIDELTKANRQILEQQKSVIQEERLKVLLQLSENTFYEINQPVKALRSGIDLIKAVKTKSGIITGHLNRMETACHQIEDTLKRMGLLRNEDTVSDPSRLSILAIDKIINILAVEDSGFSFKFLKKLLEKQKNVTLSQAKSLREARSEIESSKYDLIFLDYYLPDGEGIDFLYELKEKNTEIPVIVITGKGDEMVASRMIQAGAYEYIPKDAINRGSLFSAINKALTKFNLHQEIKLVQDKMIKMSTRDEMTGLYNYRYFIESLQQELSASTRYKYDLVVCMMDIDHFKKINDNYGHPTGDDVLVTFGKLLQENTRESDLPCRYGGEEFSVILTHTPIKNAFNMMERFRNALEKTEFSYKGKRFQVTVSIGLTVLNSNSKKTADQLIDEADQALYRAKKTGRNKTVIF